MKNERLSIYLLTLLNAILLGILIYTYLQVKNTSDNTALIHEAFERKLIYKDRMMRFQLLTEGIKLNAETAIFNGKIETIPLRSIITQPLIVLRYSELNCQSCVDAMLTQLQSNKTLDSSNTLLLAWYNNPAYLYQFKRMNRIKLPVYSIKNTGLPPDTLNIPYFYLLDKDLRVSNVFIPEEGDTASVAAYLRFAGERINQQR